MRDGVSFRLLMVRGHSPSAATRPLLFLLAGVLALGGCGDGPRGPGPVSATVEGSAPLGAAVLEVTGDGITGFQGSGSTRTFDASVGPGVYRVVVVGTNPGALPFRILVEDRAGALPSAALVSAVDGSNVPFSTVSGLSVRVVR